MKKYLPVLVLVGLLVFTTPAFAINDVTLTTDTIITAGGINFTVSQGAPTVDTLTVSGSDFSVQMSENATLIISSADRRVLTIPKVGSIIISNTCSSSQNIYTISNPLGGSQVTITATVSSDTCSTAGNGSVGGTGGGGGGGSYSLPPSVAPILAVTTPSPSAPATGGGGASASVSSVFVKAVSLGSTNSDVKRLQTLFSTDPEIYPEGLTSGYFGQATKKAIQRFQEKYGVAKKGSTGYGALGPATRAKIQEVFGGQSTNSTGASPINTTASDLQTKLKALQDQVKKIQGN